MMSNSSWMKPSLLKPTSVLFGEYSTTTGLLQQNEKSTHIQGGIWATQDIQKAIWMYVWASRYVSGHSVSVQTSSQKDHAGIHTSSKCPDGCLDKPWTCVWMDFCM